MWCCWLPACSLDCLQQGRRWTSDGTCPPASSEVTLGFPLNSSTFTPLKLETSLSSFCFKAQLLYHPFSVNQDITCLAQLQVDSPSLIYLAISLCISVDYASVLSIFHIKFWATRKQEMCLGKFPPMQQSVPRILWGHNEHLLTDLLHPGPPGSPRPMWSAVWSHLLSNCWKELTRPF